MSLLCGSEPPATAVAWKFMLTMLPELRGAKVSAPSDLVMTVFGVGKLTSASSSSRSSLS